MSTYEIASAMREKNDIQRKRLALDKEIFEHNKRMDEQQLKIQRGINLTNESAVTEIGKYADSFKNVAQSLERVNQNISVLYGKLCCIEEILQKIIKEK